jgi:hypothetical protein
MIIYERERLIQGASTQSENDVAILDRLLDGIAIVRQSDGALVYANSALSTLLGVGTGELEGAVRELARSGRTNAVELAHPDLGLIRLIVVPRDAARAAEQAWRRDLRRELARARRRSWPLTVGAIALDAGGGTHAAATAWLKVLRAEDSLAHYEEGVYLIVLPDCPADSAPGVAARLAEATPAPATASIGFTTSTADEFLDAVVKRALAALVEARAAGRSQVVLAPSPTEAG